MKTNVKTGGYGYGAVVLVLVVAFLAFLAGAYVPHAHDSGRVVHSHTAGGQYHSH